MAVTDFAEAGYDVKLRVYPKVGHVFPLNRGEELRKALDFVLDRASWQDGTGAKAGD